MARILALDKKAVSMKIAIATFAKTIGLSKVKTRLAKSIGDENAEAFYRLSVSAVREVLQKTQEQNPSIFPHWALGEEEAVDLEQWRSFPCLWTGEGGLGTRLSNVSSMGTDSPQISPKRLLQIAQMIEVNPQIEQLTGPASDGGFWLWGDVDELKDLKTLQETLEHRGETLLSAQVTLLEWLKTHNPTFQE